MNRISKFSLAAALAFGISAAGLQAAPISLSFGQDLPEAVGDLYWRTDGTAGTWTGLNWNLSSPTPTGGTGWTAGSNADFTAASTVTYVTNTAVGNVIVENGSTVTVTAAGTMPAGTHNFNVDGGSTLTWTSQAVSTASASNFTKDGLGTWNVGAQSNAYTGSFTVNAGTVIVSGNNAFGGATSVLTLNGGTVSSSGTRSFAPTSINIGGDFTWAGTGAATLGAAAGSTINLGSGVRMITNTSTGSLTLSGAVGGAGGLTFNGGTNALAGAAPNTYAAGTILSAGVLTVSKDGGLGTGNISLTAAGVTLNLQNGATNNYINDSANISLVTGSTLNLNFTGSDIVSSFIVNGASQGPGVYSSVNEPGLITGLGTITVIPEPATYMLFGLGLLACGQRFRRKKN